MGINLTCLVQEHEGGSYGTSHLVMSPTYEWHVYPPKNGRIIGEAATFENLPQTVDPNP